MLPIVLDPLLDMIPCPTIRFLLMEVPPRMSKAPPLFKSIAGASACIVIPPKVIIDPEVALMASSVDVKVKYA